MPCLGFRSYACLDFSVTDLSPDLAAALAQLESEIVRYIYFQSTDGEKYFE
jgi:hypothetical protein